MTRSKTESHGQIMFGNCARQTKTLQHCCAKSTESMLSVDLCLLC